MLSESARVRERERAKEKKKKKKRRRRFRSLSFSLDHFLSFFFPKTVFSFSSKKKTWLPSARNARHVSKRTMFSCSRAATRRSSGIPRGRERASERKTSALVAKGGGAFDWRRLGDLFSRPSFAFFFLDAGSFASLGRALEISRDRNRASLSAENGQDDE